MTKKCEMNPALSFNNNQIFLVNIQMGRNLQDHVIKQREIKQVVSKIWWNNKWLPSMEYLLKYFSLTMLEPNNWHGVNQYSLLFTCGGPPSYPSKYLAENHTD